MTVLDPALVLAAAIIGTLGYALIVARRHGMRRQWEAFWRRVNAPH
jgi:hypothetical protein